MGAGAAITKALSGESCCSGRRCSNKCWESRVCHHTQCGAHLDCVRRGFLRCTHGNSRAFSPAASVHGCQKQCRLCRTETGRLGESMHKSYGLGAAVAQAQSVPYCLLLLTMTALRVLKITGATLHLPKQERLCIQRSICTQLPPSTLWRLWPSASNKPFGNYGLTRNFKALV